VPGRSRLAGRFPGPATGNFTSVSKSLPIKLISTDFDGTLFAEFENPPIPHRLQALIQRLQSEGAKWVINTGRDMSSLMETLGRTCLAVEPDFLVLVEREVFLHHDSQYLGLAEWNQACERAHVDLYARVVPDLPRIISWIEARFHACIYADAFSPFCLIAQTNRDADTIHEFLDDYCREVPNLTVVRNDVYARFSHADFNKGTALAELTRREGLTRDAVFAIGDHLNDLPMLLSHHARFLAAPSNAVPAVKELVRRQGGYLSALSHGHGVADALQHYLDRH